jgi:hypothetical protein
MHALTCTAQHATFDDVNVVEIPNSVVAPNVKDSTCLIQHDYGKGFCEQFGIPNWKSFRPYDHGKSGQWDKIAAPEVVQRVNDGTGLCIAVYSWGWYDEYIPLFAYFALSAYPGAYVKIYSPGTLASNVVAGLNDVATKLSPRVEVVTNYQVAPHFAQRKHTRWMFPESEFEDFDYVYIGDVDMFIAPEQPDLVNFHLAHAAANDIPYSNLRRWSVAEKASGLHFMIREPYYAAMTPIIEHYTKNCPQAKYMDGRTNEQFLCHILTETFGPPPRLMEREAFEAQRPHHGYHMGLLRSHKPGKHYYVPYWERMAPAIRPIVADPLFTQLVGRIHSEFARSRIAMWVDWLRQQRQDLPAMQLAGGPAKIGPANRAPKRKPVTKRRRESKLLSDPRPKPITPTRRRVSRRIQPKVLVNAPTRRT